MSSQHIFVIDYFYVMQTAERWSLQLFEIDEEYSYIKCLQKKFKSSLIKQTCGIRISASNI